MIITKTPFRISFFGGGSDYPAWYRENEGAVLASSINKYCYIFGRWMPHFFECKHKIVWSEIEICEDIEKIHHPAVRGILKYLDIQDGVEIHHIGDLPARTGIGSSSSFSVGLLNCLYGLKGVNVTKRQLADEAIHIEQDILKENVGSQDQTIASYGGFNKITFKGDTIKVIPVTKGVKQLENNLMLFFTGFSRTASVIAKDYIDGAKVHPDIIESMHKMVEEGIEILERKDIKDFGLLLHEGWQLKHSLSKKISTDYIDFLYHKAKIAGATGGKLCGAGGGGFLLLFVEPDKQKNVQDALSSLVYVPFRFENEGTKVIFNGG